VEVEQNPINKC